MLDYGIIANMNKYLILSAAYPERLEEDVNLFIQRGYRPIGGIAIAIDQGRYVYAQAMVKM